MRKYIPVAEPIFVGNEKKYVDDCLDSTWISSNGKYIDQFEEAFSAYIGVKHAISVVNGTVALHAALLGLGLQPGDEVIVPTLTYIATANAVSYCGAIPVFVDSEPDSWNIDPAKIEERITPRTRGIIPVHLYGHPADMDAIAAVAGKHGLFVLEDAAEAHGAEYKGCLTGSLGDAAIFSFYGNKIITCGEGGMIVTDDDALAMRIRQIKGQGQDFERRYWFPIIGYNYRMTNIQAAIGLAQLEQIDWHIVRRREVANWYKEFFDGVEGVHLHSEKPGVKHVYWMNSVILDPYLPPSRDEVMAKLMECGIETRPVFYPLHTMPIYVDGNEANHFPVASFLSMNGINLPTSALLTKEEVLYISETLIEGIGKS